MTSKTPYGYWTTDAPLTPGQVDEDTELLRGISIPDGIHLDKAEIYVNGRAWHWEMAPVSFGSIRREPSDV